MRRRPLEWNLNGTTDPRDGSVDHLSLNSLKDRHRPIRAPKSCGSMTRLLCMRLGAGQSGAILVILNIAGRIAPASRECLGTPCDNMLRDNEERFRQPNLLALVLFVFHAS